MSNDLKRYASSLSNQSENFKKQAAVVNELLAGSARKIDRELLGAFQQVDKDLRRVTETLKTASKKCQDYGRNL